MHQKYSQELVVHPKKPAVQIDAKNLEILVIDLLHPKMGVRAYQEDKESPTSTSLMRGHQKVALRKSLNVKSFYCNKM